MLPVTYSPHPSNGGWPSWMFSEMHAPQVPAVSLFLQYSCFCFVPLQSFSQLECEVFMPEHVKKSRMLADADFGSPRLIIGKGSFV